MRCRQHALLSLTMKRLAQKVSGPRPAGSKVYSSSLIHNILAPLGVKRSALPTARDAEIIQYAILQTLRADGADIWLIAADSQDETNK